MRCNKWSFGRQHKSKHLLQWNPHWCEAEERTVNARSLNDEKLIFNCTYWVVSVNYWYILIFIQVKYGNVLIFPLNLQHKMPPSTFIWIWNRQKGRVHFQINSSGRFPGSALWDDIFRLLTSSPLLKGSI